MRRWARGLSLQLVSIPVAPGDTLRARLDCPSGQTETWSGSISCKSGPGKLGIRKIPKTTHWEHDFQPMMDARGLAIELTLPADAPATTVEWDYTQDAGMDAIVTWTLSLHGSESHIVNFELPVFTTGQDMKKAT